MSDGNSLDLPFEEVPGGGFSAEIPALIAGGLVIRAACAETSNGPTAALVFDFYLVDGTKLDSVLLVSTDEQMEKHVELTRLSVDSALRAVRAARS